MRIRLSTDGAPDRKADRRSARRAAALDEDGGQYQHRHRGEREYNAPTEQLCDHATERPRDQHAHQQAARHRPDDLAALVRAARRGHRHDHLAYETGHADEHHRRREHRKVGCDRGHRLPAGEADKRDRDQPAPLEQVAERHQECEAEYVPTWLIVTSGPVVAVPTAKALPSVCSSGCA